MGIYDILQKHGIEYKQLTGLIQDMSGCVDFNAESVVRQLDEIYDEEEYRRDFPKKKKRVWLVIQTQPSAGYEHEAIAVFDDETKAIELARVLNIRYSRGVELTDKGDYYDIDPAVEDHARHFYTVERQVVNPETEIFID